MNQEQRLPNSVLFGYGLSAMPVIYAYMLILIMYMKYAVDDLGASPGAIGTIFLIAKLWDAVSDPLVGSLSDQTERPDGRRRPWIKAAAPLLALFGVMAWAPPTSLGPIALNLWITVAVLGFYTAFTIFEVPHMALGAEITLDARARNRVFGVRQAMRVVGMLAAGTLGVYLVQQGVEAARLMSYCLAIASIVFIYAGLTFLPPERVDFKGRGGANPFSAIRDVLANPHARLLLFVVFIDSIGTGGIGTLTPFVIEYVVQREDLVPILLGANMIAAFVSIPLWLALSHRFEKRHLMILAMLMSAVGYGGVIFVGEGDWHIIAVSAVTAGLGSACLNTLGYSLKAEIIDSDEYRTGQRKEGAYFAGWAFVSKFATGLMIALVGFALEGSGFVPNQIVQSENVEWTMLLLMGGFPFICYSTGAILFSRFRLTEAEHARIRAVMTSRDPSSRDLSSRDLSSRDAGNSH